MQLSSPTAFPRSSLGAETTCVAPVGNSGLMTPGSPALPAPLSGLQICSGVCQCGGGGGGAVSRGQTKGEKPAVKPWLPLPKAVCFSVCCLLLLEVHARRGKGRCGCPAHSHTQARGSRAWNACTLEREQFSSSELIQNYSTKKWQLKVKCAVLI